MNTTPVTSVPGSAARSDLLVDPGWLAARLHDPAVRVVEVDVSRAAYDQWHIDQAVLWNVYADLRDADYRPVDDAAVGRLLARSGIRPDMTVVLYGYAPAMGLWLMKLYGHQDVKILDCSRDTWHAEGHACSSTPAAPAVTSYPLPGQDKRLRADRAAVRDAIGAPGTTIVDRRSLEGKGGGGGGGVGGGGGGGGAG